MPISTFFGLETTLRGILAHQQAIDTTGHNVTNANTEGYSRQTATLGATDPYMVTAGAGNGNVIAHIGTGVGVQSYDRIRSQFLDLQYRAQAMQVGYQQTTSEQLDQVEMGLAEPGTNGLSAQLNKFWSTWSDVANTPSDPAARQALIDQAQNLTATFKAIDQQLANVKSQATAQYAAITGPGGDVETIATQITQLNASIKAFVAGGDKPNDLLDRRDVLLDKLSKLGQVSITDLGNGSIDVSFGGTSTPLVADTTMNWPQTLDSTSPPAGGQLGALLKITDSSPPAATPGIIDQYRTQLNAVAKQLADNVNAFHNPGGTGTNFFTYGAAGTEAATLTVNVGVAGVRTSTSGAAGDNDIARQITNLRGGTADKLYTAFVTKIGGDLKNAQTGESNATVLLDSIQDRRQSVSGVSLDEEMTNLVRFQRGYQASARAMSTIDQMLDTLINRTGSVGL
jgi:flagellar hook-associated protein 1 FlgK